MFDSEEFINDVMEFGIEQLAQMNAVEDVKRSIAQLVYPNVKTEVSQDQFGITVRLSTSSMGDGGFEISWHNLLTTHGIFPPGLVRHLLEHTLHKMMVATYLKPIQPKE